MDMGQAYQPTKEALAEWHTKICFDTSQIATDLNKAVDDVHKVELRALPSQYRKPLYRSRFSRLRSHLRL
jgi:hypothetical protein